MAVAKSYEKYEQIGTPFTEDGKKWVRVKGVCPRCGGSGHYSMNAMGDSTCYKCNGKKYETLVVRWYTDAQRTAMDRAAEKRKNAVKEENHYKFSARIAFGFGEEGYITIVWGDNEAIKEWRMDLPQYSVWYNTIFGWYIPSKNNIDVPEQFHTYKLMWDEVRDPADTESLQMKPNDIVTAYVEQVTIGSVESPSKYQGTVNEWLEKEVTIKQNIEVESHYGMSHMHIMEDNEQNVYIWTTSSKNIAVGTIIKLKMKVKEHKEYKGVQQTIVYYCKESKM